MERGGATSRSAGSSRSTSDKNAAQLPSSTIRSTFEADLARRQSIVKAAAARREGRKSAEVCSASPTSLDVRKDLVYQKKLVVDKTQVRVTAHRTKDALLGALTVATRRLRRASPRFRRGRRTAACSHGLRRQRTLADHTTRPTLPSRLPGARTARSSTASARTTARFQLYQ